MPFTLVFKWTSWMCYLSHTGVTLVTIILLTLCERLFSGIEMLWWFFPSFVLFYNRHISLKLAYIEEKVMICECDGYKWMGPCLSSVALTTSTVEDRFSFTGNKDIREHFVFRLRTQPWIGLSCIRGRHSSASFLSFVDWRLKHCSANNKRGCFAPSSNVVCFNDPVCVCFDTWFQPRHPFRSLNCIMVFL